MLDYLIVGQGLAGTLLAHFLLEKGKKILVIDNTHHAAASKVAAGIINPVTGRRLVKSWRFDEFLACANETYPTLEKQLGLQFYHKKNILRALYNLKQENDWLLKSADSSTSKYMLGNAELSSEIKAMKPVFSWGEMQHSAQVDIPKLIEAFRERLLENNRFVKEKLEYTQLGIQEKSVHYKGIKAKKVLFCEGYQSIKNPYFNYLPHQAAKGEVLIVCIPNFQSTKLLKHGVFLVQLEREVYWVGSTYSWDFKDEKPTEKGREDLEKRLQKALDIPYEILEHKAAIRPVFRDRRPMIGLHPKFPTLGIFNGLGTKGASLAPYWAKHFAEFLCGEVDLDKEVDLGRIRNGEGR